MYNHAPEGYKCPICLGVQGIESEDTMLKQGDLIFKDEVVSVFINSFFINGNEGHLIVVPNDHYENIYDMPDEVGERIFSVSKNMAQALKLAYKCEGITIRQNNEPAGDQHAFHYHLHVFPRYEGDKFNTESGNKRATTEEERQEYIKKLKEQLEITRSHQNS
jgi:histidine triad (HIT) family protein